MSDAHENDESIDPSDLMNELSDIAGLSVDSRTQIFL